MTVLATVAGVPLDFHGIGVGSALSNLPDPVVALFAVVTILGDPAFLFAGVALLHWRAPRLASTPRRATATLVAVGLAAAAVTIALKGTFAVHRPAGATEAGYAFPSGHALGAAAVYGGAARLFDRLDGRRRRVAAGVLVTAVAVSRLVVGVHVLLDVVTGVAVGLTLAWVLVRLGPSRSFAVAAVAGVPAVLLAGPTSGGEAAAVLGGGVGGGLAWHFGYGGGMEPVAPRVLVPVVVVAAGAAATAETIPLSPPVAAALGVVAAGLVVGLPGVVAGTSGDEKSGRAG